ncbi:MAG TPA: HAD family hydrolase [Gaiellaceae bacterium]|nr:HAD family hydrolase [Gaiellaceae bacterium]
MTLRPAAFLDRDGVLNERPPAHDYVREIDQLVLLPGAAEAVRRLAGAGYVPVVVSNQRGVARGLVTWQTLRAVEEALVRETGGPIAFYYCPHDDADACDCRKPAPGLLLRAAAELGLDLACSVMIGDTESDVEAGRAAGTATIRIAPPGTATGADATAPDLAEAAAIVLSAGAQQNAPAP